MNAASAYCMVISRSWTFLGLMGRCQCASSVTKSTEKLEDLRNAHLEIAAPTPNLLIFLFFVLEMLGFWMGIGVEILQFRLASNTGGCGVEDWREEAKGCLQMEVFHSFMEGGMGIFWFLGGTGGWWWRWCIFFLSIFLFFLFSLLCWLSFFYFTSFASEVKLNLKILMIEYCKWLIEREGERERWLGEGNGVGRIFLKKRMINGK